MASEARQFEDFNLNRQLYNAIEDAGYFTPTSIQQKAIPIILGGHDLIGIAQTGTGKTAAYLLPLLYKVKFPQGQHPRALILAPSKELVIQIYENLMVFSKYCQTRNICLYGGIGPKTQIEELQSGADIIVATPGRFLDIYSRGSLVVKEIKTLILDEADKMMDMGFAPQIREILEKIPRKRQNLLFSATYPEKVQRIANEFLTFPHKIEVTPQSTPAKNVGQTYYHTPNLHTKISLLEHLLQDPQLQRVMVFTRTKDTANNVFKFIERKCGGDVRVIHANKGQNSRINAFNEFRSGQIRVLVTTDVTARGVDIEEVSHVINFDVPRLHEEYVHRIGRTGRADKSGLAITFATEVELIHLQDIEKIMGVKIPETALPPEIVIVPTSKEETKEIALEIDNIRRRRDPEFKGAFHEKKFKKKKVTAPRVKKQSGRKRI